MMQVGGMGVVTEEGGKGVVAVVVVVVVVVWWLPSHPEAGRLPSLCQHEPSVQSLASPVQQV